MPLSIRVLAELCQAEIVGSNIANTIVSAADIKSAGQNQITQFTDNRYAPFLKDSKASACIIGKDMKPVDAPDSLVFLICSDPEMSFITAVRALHPETDYGDRISPQAVLAEKVDLGAKVYIGPYVVIGEQSRIGDYSALLACSYIGRNVTIGKNCRIHPYSVIYDGVQIGDNVTVHAGAIIGADGFGYKFRNNRHIKVPQVGNVVIEDHVEIGANTCIDRGALGSTVIGNGSKIDNLVQIGHNNNVGKHVIMCGQTGVSGSCNIEDYAILAGSSGIADHVTVGTGAVVMARAGVAGNVPAGMQVFGSPAKEKKIAYKEQIALSKLPDLIKKIKVLEEKIEILEKSAGDR